MTVYRTHIRVKRGSFLEFFPEFCETNFHLKVLRASEEELGQIEKARVSFTTYRYLESAGMITYYFPEKRMISLVYKLSKKSRKEEYSIQDLKNIWEFLTGDGKIRSFKLMPDNRLIIPMGFRNFKTYRISLGNLSLDLAYNRDEYSLLTFPKERFFPIDTVVKILEKSDLLRLLMCRLDIVDGNNGFQAVDFTLAFQKTFGILPKPFKIYFMFRQWEK